MHINRRLGSLKIEFSCLFLSYRENRPHQYRKLWQGGIYSPRLESSCHPQCVVQQRTSLFIAASNPIYCEHKMPAGFWLLDVMFCYEWVEVVLCCSGSDGATHGDALPSHRWGLSAFSKPWCDGKSQAGGDQTQFLSLKQMFLEVNFFPQAFPVIPAMLPVYFFCKLWALVLLC